MCLYQQSNLLTRSGRDQKQHARIMGLSLSQLFIDIINEHVKS